MNILGLCWGICSSASLVVDGEAIAATHEEQFTRLKNDDGFPMQAIEFCLEKAGLRGEDLHGVAVASHHQDYFHQLTRPGRWSVQDYIDEQHKFWFPTLLNNEKIKYSDALSHLIDRQQYPREYWSDLSKGDVTFPKDRVEIVAKYLQIDLARVHTVEHHLGHARYAYYSSEFIGREVLAFYIDASGDGLNATIGMFHSNGDYKRLVATSSCNLARLYRYVTLILGMKPNEHEYKVMGIAPYGEERYGEVILNIFRNLMSVECIEFI